MDMEITDYDKFFKGSWADDTDEESYCVSDCDGENDDFIETEHNNSKEDDGIAAKTAPKFCQLGSPPEFYYSYLKSCYFFDFNDASTLIEISRSVHACYLDCNDRLSKAGWEPIPEIVDLYFRIRHDLFSTLCKTMLMSPPFSLETDNSLSLFGIITNKTPDLVIEMDNGHIIIIEFTVTHKRDSVDEYKGTAGQDLKYSDELNDLRDNGKDASIYIIPLVLSEFNSSEICDIIEKISPHNSVEKDIKHLLNIFCYRVRDINLSYKYSLREEVDFGPIVEKDYLSVNSDLDKMSTFSYPEGMHAFMIDPSVYSRIYSSMDSMKRKLLSLSSKWGDTRIYCVYDTADDSLKVKITFNFGCSLKISEWLPLFENSNVKEIISNIVFVNRNKLANRSDYSGTLPITIKVGDNNLPVTTKSNKLSYDSYMQPFTVDDVRKSGNSITYNKSRETRKKVMFDPGYYNNLVNCLDHNKISDICKQDIIANNKCTKKTMIDSLNSFNDQYNSVNKVPFLRTPKKTLIIPYALGLIYGDYKKIDESFLEQVYYSIDGMYTKKCIQKLISGNIVKNMVDEIDNEINVKKRMYNACNTDYYNRAREIYGNYKIPKWCDLRKCNDDNLSKLKRKVDKSRVSYLSSLSKRTDKAAINVVKMKTSNSKLDFKKETTHFSKGVRKGVGILSANESKKVNNFFQWFLLSMLEKNTSNISENLYSRERGPGPQYLTDLKNWHTDRFDKFSECYAKSSLAWACEFVGRLGHSLMKESSKPYNKDYVKFDNLGYSNVLLIIKGGSKIFKSQESKMYRLIYPISNLPYKFLGFGNNTDYKVSIINGLETVITPWERMRQDVICDCMTMLRRVFFHMYVYSERSGKCFDNITKDCLFPVLLAFHNRRKTEELVHNTRYLIVNQLGDYSSMNDMIKGFGTFNYTYLDSWIKDCIIHNFSDLVESLFDFKNQKTRSALTSLENSKLKHLWTCDPINTIISFTTLIYSTYLMTKAPINQSIEQANNLKNVLKDVDLFEKTHDDVLGLDDFSLRSDVCDLKSNPYNDDFNYDPKYCQFMGYYMSNVISANIGVSDIEDQWKTICNYESDFIANSRGMRGTGSGDFFGNKGYEVVYSELMKKHTIDKVKDSINLYNCCDDPKLVANLVKSDKYSISNMIKDNPPDEFRFHIVPKIQRAGPREIYAMDIKTKSVQNPIEKFIGWICSKLPNESISVPSNRRHHDVHTTFFEKNPGPWVDSVMRWVLDCRRWGPHSVFQKYVHFIRGMEPVLPKSFIKLFYYTAKMMFTKKIFTKLGVSKILKNNNSLKDICSHLIDSTSITGACYFNMKFSFVMGIFNYLSSFMHCANQLLASELIRDYCLKKNLGLCVINMKAHSDDSAGKSFHSKKESIEPSIILYDWLLKASNHMLSVKKSVINNDIYFEFLSVLYLKDRLLPLINKFVSMPFKPTDQGYSSDISFSAAQSIEILTYGGTIEESFLMMKLTEKFIQRFYGLNPSYKTPHCFLGGIDSYPIELILSGTDSEYVKHMKYNPRSTNRIEELLNDKMLLEQSGNCDLTLKWDLGCRMKRSLFDKFGPFIKYLKKNQSKIWESWTVKNIKLGNSLLNIIWYLSKLDDPRFYSSLISEPVSRRIARAYSAANKKNLVSKDGNFISASVLTSLIKAITDEISFENIEVDSKRNKFYFNINEELNSFWDILDGMEFKPNFIPNNLTLKPTRINLGLPSLGSITINPSAFVCIVKEPHLSGLINVRKGYDYQVSAIKDKIKGFVDLDKSDLYQIQKAVAKTTGREKIACNIVGTVESDNRNITSMESLMGYLSTNLISNNKIVFDTYQARKMDVARRFRESSIPDGVLEIVNHFWAYELVKKYKVEDSDIYNGSSPDLMLKESIDTIPYGWANMIETQIKPMVKLSECLYWKVWIKEQFKVSNSWIGKGQLLFKIPEMTVNAELNGPFFTKFVVTDQTDGYFSEASSWYIQNVVMPDSSFIAQCVNSDYLTRDKFYLGFNKSKFSWGYGMPSMFDMALELTDTVDDLNEMLLEDSVRVETEGTEMYVRSASRKYKVESLLSYHGGTGLDMKRYLSAKKIATRISKGDRVVMEFVERCSIDNDKEFKYSSEDSFERNAVATKTYEILSQSKNAMKVFKDPIEQNTSFLESMLEFRERNPDFKFPSKQQILSIHKDTNAAPLPEKMINLLAGLGVDGLTQSQLDYIESELTRASGDNIEQVFERIMQAFGKGVAFESMVIFGFSDDRMLKGCAKLHNRKIIHELIETLIIAAVECIADGECDYSSMIGLGSLSIKDVTQQAIHNFKIISTVAIYDADCFFNLCCDDIKSVRLLIERLNIMMGKGLMEYLETNKRSFNNQYYSVTEFKDLKLCQEWIIDLFDSLCCLSNEIPEFKDCISERVNLIRTNYKILARGTSVAKWSRNLSMTVSFNLSFSKRRKIIKQATMKSKFKPAVINKGVFPIIDEYTIPFKDELLSNPTLQETAGLIKIIREDWELESEWKDSFLYTEPVIISKSISDANKLSSYMGTSKMLIIESPVIPYNHRMIPGRFSVWIKDRMISDWDFIYYSTRYYLLIVPNNVKNIDIKGFTKLSDSEVDRRCHLERLSCKQLKTKNGKYIDRWDKSFLTDDVESILNTNITILADKEYKVINSILPLYKENVSDSDENYNKILSIVKRHNKELVSRKKRRGKKINDNISDSHEKGFDISHLELKDVLTEMLNLLKESGGIKGLNSDFLKKVSTSRRGFFKVQDTIRLIKDPRVRAELNQCTGFHMDSLLKGEVFLNKESIDMLTNIIDLYMSTETDYSDSKNKIAKGFMMKYILTLVNITENEMSINNDFFRVVTLRFYKMDPKVTTLFSLPEPETRKRVDFDMERWVNSL